MDLLAKGRQCGLDLQHLVAVEHTAVHACLAHQLGGLGAGFKVGGRREEVQDAALEPVVFDAGARHQALERSVAVGAQRHQLPHIAGKGSVVALGEELGAPAPLVRVELGAEQQWRVIAQQPLGHLQWRASVGPGLAEAHRDLGAVGKAGFQRGARLAVHHCHLVTLLGQVPGGADADDAGAENDDLLCLLLHAWKTSLGRRERGAARLEADSGQEPEFKEA